MSAHRDRVSVLGAGAWGTAMACVLARRVDTVLWTRDSAQADALRRDRRNEHYLPEIAFPDGLDVESDLGTALRGADWLIAATPVAGLRELVGRLRAAGTRSPLVWLSKGFERESALLPHQVVAEELGVQHPCAVLSGPSFALEVARGQPCALTLAATDADVARAAAAFIHAGTLRVYYTQDLVGVEVAGAVKNVMAIAVGICDGLGLGQSARAALITRGLAEITRLGVALGGAAETFMGLAGAGDLILTATGDLSRNRRVGLELAKGRSVGDILAGLGHVAEGVHTAREVSRLALRHSVDMPITDAVNTVLDGRFTPREAVNTLLNRDPRSER